MIWFEHLCWKRFGCRVRRVHVRWVSKNINIILYEAAANACDWMVNALTQTHTSNTSKSKSNRPKISNRKENENKNDRNFFCRFFNRNEESSNTPIHCMSWNQQLAEKKEWSFHLSWFVFWIGLVSTVV